MRWGISETAEASELFRGFAGLNHSITLWFLKQQCFSSGTADASEGRERQRTIPSRESGAGRRDGLMGQIGANRGQY